jgi:3-hydroxyisobutyrate/3-hydroxypropionate dehydrogenase
MPRVLVLSTFVIADLLLQIQDVINASSGMCWNSLHMSPIKGVQPTSSASRDFKGGPDGGPGFDLATENTEMTVGLMSQVNAKSVMAEVMRDIWKRAASTYTVR